MDYPPFGPPLLHLDDLDMILWNFPNDRHLPTLPLLIDEDRLRTEVMPALVERRLGPDWSIASLSSTLISYVHERRCAVRVDLVECPQHLIPTAIVKIGGMRASFQGRLQVSFVEDIPLALRSIADERRSWLVFGKTASDDSDSMVADASARYWQGRHFASDDFNMPNRSMPRRMAVSPGRKRWPARHS